MAGNEWQAIMATNEGAGRSSLLGLLAWMVAVTLAAGLGAIGSADAPAFYGRLLKPDWAPPAGLFGPVWTLLYASMGVAAWLVWRRHGFSGAAVALGLFVAQLAVNALWSWLFFQWRLGLLACIDIAILCVLVLATIVAFWRRSPLAGALLLPYLLWIVYAAALSLRVWQLNPGLLG